MQTDNRRTDAQTEKTDRQTNSLQAPVLFIYVGTLHQYWTSQPASLVPCYRLIQMNLVIEMPSSCTHLYCREGYAYLPHLRTRILSPYLACVRFHSTLDLLVGFLVNAASRLNSSFMQQNVVFQQLLSSFHQSICLAVSLPGCPSAHLPSWISFAWYAVERLRRSAQLIIAWTIGTKAISRYSSCSCAIYSLALFA